MFSQLKNCTSCQTVLCWQFVWKKKISGHSKQSLTTYWQVQAFGQVVLYRWLDEGLVPMVRGTMARSSLTAEFLHVVLYC